MCLDLTSRVDQRDAVDRVMLGDDILVSGQLYGVLRTAKFRAQVHLINEHN